MANINRTANRKRSAAPAKARPAEPAKVAKAPAVRAPRKPAEPVRMKIIWEVHGSTGKPVKAFPYVEKPQAEAEALRLTRSTGRTHVLQPAKVPMD